MARLLLCAVALWACAEPAPPNPHGLRVRPTATGWAVRWQGRRSAELDGEARPAARGLQISGDRAHRLRLGEDSLELPPRDLDPCAPVRLAVVGDGRANLLGVGAGAYYRGVLQEAAARGPALIVNTGDLVKRGEDPEEWRRYLQVVPAWPPMLAVRGNHDRGRAIYDLDLSPSELWAIPLGPALLVGLDSELPEGEYRATLRRLDALLNGARASFVILFQHRPLWSRGNHGSDERGLNAPLLEILDRHHVALVISGHDHNYERFCPQRADRRCRPSEEGTTYVVTGGAATFTNPLPGLARGVPEAVARADDRTSRSFSGARHFVELDIADGRLRGRAHRTRVGNLRPPGIIDTFEIDRPPEASCPR